MRLARLSQLFALLTAGLLLSGCGAPKLPTGTVSGKVTMGGKAVTGATIMFAPKAVGSGASAKLGADGSYSLMSSDGSGVAAGDYGVSFVPNPASDTPPDPAALMEKKDDKENPKPPEGPIPRKYTNAQTSGLTFTVKAGQSNTADFDLKAE